MPDFKFRARVFRARFLSKSFQNRKCFFQIAIFFDFLLPSVAKNRKNLRHKVRHGRDLHGLCGCHLACDVEEKFTKFSGKPRDARKICVIRPIFGQILSKIDVKLQNRALPKFQILVSESKIDLYSKIENRSSKSKPLKSLESRFET